METDYMNQISFKPVPPTPKTPVRVLLMCNEKGQMTPLYIIWEDGEKYKIEEVLDIKPRGVNSITYKVKIKGRERELYYDRNVWLVTKKRC